MRGWRRRSTLIPSRVPHPLGFGFAKGAGFDFSFVSSAQSRKEAFVVA
jgi:hypothetical protein